MVCVRYISANTLHKRDNVIIIIIIIIIITIKAVPLTASLCLSLFFFSLFCRFCRLGLNPISHMNSASKPKYVEVTEFEVMTVVEIKVMIS
jgi:hypothetical protein